MRSRSVSQKFKVYQVYEKENKPNAIKSRCKTNKTSTAVKQTELTVTTADGKIIHKKLPSNPLKIQSSKQSEEVRKRTIRCRRCGKFSQGEDCDTYKRLMAESKTKQQRRGQH